MAKTESTAVNQLIELVSTQKPLPKDPDEDLMFTTPKRKVSAPRMSATVTGHAMDVAPLPRARAPQGTQQGVPVIPGPSAVRVTTAPPSRMVTIPPISGAPPIPVPAVSMAVSPPPIPPTADMRQTRPSLPPPIRPSTPRTSAAHLVVPSPTRTTAPVSMPIAAPFEPVPSGHVIAAQSYPAAPMAYPSAAPYLAHVPHDMTSNQEWFDENEVLHDAIEIQHDIGTSKVPKQADWKTMVGKLVGPMIGLVIVGIFVGGYFAFDGEGGKPREAKAAAVREPTQAVAAGQPLATEPAKAEPAAEPAHTEPTHSEPVQPAQTEPITPPNLVNATTEPVKVEPVKAEPVKVEPVKAEPVKAEPVKAEPAIALAPTAPVAPAHVGPVLVDVRIDSQPSGATVMLVDRGKTTFLGNTPVSAAVDPSRTYDLVFTYANKPTQLEHLDAATTKRVAVVLGKPGNHAVKAAAVVAPVAPKVDKVLPKTEKVAPPKIEKVAARPAAAVVDPFETKAAAPVPAGEGTLMISSKPPCEILVDGKPTGLMTPQRAIKLAAGTHKVTLVNPTEKIKKTLTVQITADEPTKVIQDLMK